MQGRVKGVYYINANGYIWNFDILYFNGPPPILHKWIYTWSLGDGINNSCEILIEYAASDEPFFSVTNRGHTLHKFAIKVRHRYSASVIIGQGMTTFGLVKV